MDRRRAAAVDIVGSQRPRLRSVMAGASAILLILLLAMVLVAGYAVLSPFTGVAVQPACDGVTTAEPSARRVQVPGIGDGMLVASAGRTRVVAVPAADGRTAGGSAQVLAGPSVVFRLPITSRAVAAGIAQGRVYLFDDKLGYIVDAATGAEVPRLLTVDNYRGLYSSGGEEFVQTSLLLAAVGMGGQPLTVVEIPFGAVVDGCLLASAAGG